MRETLLAPFDENWKTDARPGEVVLEYVGPRARPAPGSDLEAVHTGYVSVTTLARHRPRRGSHGAAESIAATRISRRPD